MTAVVSNFYSEWYLKNSIIASNIDHGGEKPDLSNGSLVIPSLDYNLIGDLGTTRVHCGCT